MFDPTKYGVPAEDAAHIRNMDDLTKWLDANPQAPTELHPAIQSVGTPEHSSDWRAALWRRMTKEESAGYRVGMPPDWEKVVKKRRGLTVVLTCLLTLISIVLTAWLMIAESLPEWVIGLGLIALGIMQFFVNMMFIKTMIGNIYALFGYKSNIWHPSRTACDPDDDTRVAVLYPVYHEDVARVCAGMASVWESLVRGADGHHGKYDIFLLSDSRKAGYFVAEKAAVLKLRKMYPEARFHYRRRPFNDHAKLGNVSDFCRRWGKRYKYMFVMDADSLMSGKTIHTTLRMMEGNHRLGILQTNPRPVLRHTLFGRMQQFAGNLYGAVMSYSLQAMHMGHANYIGHNAMIRTDLFIQHCTLPTLDGAAPWGGKPLSHDIIEAALMARAGYEVWFLPELQGSWEEIPADIMSFMVRERRWMQGNLQHLRFLFMDGITSTHTDFFVNGMFGYLSAPLWALFLLISSYGMISFMKSGRLEFNEIGIVEIPALMMLVTSLVIMFLPRVLSLILNFKTGKCELYGGKMKMILSMFLETVFSLFFAPLMMVFMTRFIYYWAIRKSVSWDAQQRGDDEMSWKQCFHDFGWVSLTGIAITAFLLYQISTVPTQQAALIAMASHGDISPSSVLVWFAPILGGMVFAPVIAKFVSKTFPSLLARGYFAIPEEIEVPPEFETLYRVRLMLENYIPDVDNLQECVTFAATNEDFYVGQRPSARPHRDIPEKFLPMIENGEAMTEKEFLLMLRDRASYDAFHKKYANAA